MNEVIDADETLVASIQCEKLSWTRFRSHATRGRAGLVCDVRNWLAAWTHRRHEIS